MRHPRRPNESPSVESSGGDDLTPSRARDLNDPLQIGITIVGTTAVFGGIGWWLDGKLHTFPILMAVGAVLGLFGIIYVTYQRLQEADRQARQAKRESMTTKSGERE